MGFVPGGDAGSPVRSQRRFSRTSHVNRVIACRMSCACVVRVCVETVRGSGAMTGRAGGA